MTTRSAPRAPLLFVSHTGVIGGAELSLLDIVVDQGDRARVVLLRDGPFRHRLESAGVAVRILDAGAALDLVKKETRTPPVRALGAITSSALALARAARGASLLYANSPKSFLVSAAAGLLARRPVVWHLRDILDAHHFSRANVRRLVRVANARAARVIANSHATARAFIAAGGRAPLVTVVHNGIDAAPFDADHADGARHTRESLGIPADAFVVGMFSRLHPWKGQRVLLDAVAELPAVHVLLVGGALFSGEEHYADELRRRADHAPLRGRVHLLGARADVPSLMQACDIVAHPSIWPEPFGRVLVEALLARRALVASDAGGVREIVEDERTALLVPPQDAGALRRAIARLQGDPALRAELAARGAADMRDRFTREAMLAGVARVLAEVLR